MPKTAVSVMVSQSLTFRGCFDSRPGMWRGIADSPGLLASLQPILVLGFLAGVKSGDGFFDAHVIARSIYIDLPLALFAFVFSD